MISAFGVDEEEEPQTLYFMQIVLSTVRADEEEEPQTFDFCNPRFLQPVNLSFRNNLWFQNFGVYF